MKAIGRAIRTLKEVLAKNKTLRLGLAYGLIGIAAMVALTVGMRGLAASRQASSQGNASAVQEPTGTDGTSNQTEQEQTPAQSYSGVDADVVAALMSYSWTDGGTVVTFGPSEATVTKNGGQETSSDYAVSQTHDGGSQTEASTTMADSTLTVRTYTFILEYGDTAYPATLKSSQKDGSSQAMTLTCDALSSKSLNSTSASNELQVKDVGQLLQYVGGSATPLEEALRSWASKNSPAATEAKWDGIVTIDTSSNTATFSMTLSAATQSKVSVTYKATDGTFKVSYSK